jgi:mono/diheme cytochrome c family protein
MSRNWILVWCLAIAALLMRSATAQGQAKAGNSSASSAAAAATASSREMHHAALPPASRDVGGDERLARLEGEKRFRTNCGRCHQPPHKFPPRVMATAIRHMRVRAMITDEDMKFILRYMTQ